MCGIAGFIDTGFQYETLEKITNSLHRRGPDSFGFYYENQIGLGHRRLSIIELSELGAQPYRYEQLVLVFNGELYNYQEVKKELESEGYTFKSNSDTEVLIKAFHKWKEKAVDRFIGMFAFAVYDKESEELFLFRDKVGVKPLYYGLQNGLVFGSELKVFKALPFKYTLDQEAIHQYFKFGYITNDLTIYSEVKKLLPGHYLKYKKGLAEVFQYWNVGEAKKVEVGGSIEEATERLEALLKSAFNYRMVSDVPVGVFLSGGIDSSLVTAILQKEHKTINTFTIGFDNVKYNEAPHAKQVAAALGTVHHEYILKGADAKELLYNFYDIYDEPFSDSSGIPTALVSGLARKENIKVVLSADGGDELFCGYTHYERIRKTMQYYLSPGSSKTKLQSFLIRQLDKSGLLNNLYSHNIEHKLLTYESRLLSSDVIELYENSIANQSDAEIEKLIGIVSKFKSIRYRNKGLQPIEEMMQWDFLHYLPDDLLVKVDRATMYNSIEGREPFLDHRLVEFAYALPLSYKVKEGKNKYILKKILNNYLPAALFERPKQGFSIPIFQWFSDELGELIEEYLSDDKLKETGLFNVMEVKKELAKFHYYKQKQQDYNIEKIYRILSFMMWWDKWNRQ